MLELGSTTRGEVHPQGGLPAEIKRALELGSTKRIKTTSEHSSKIGGQAGDAHPKGYMSNQHKLRRSYLRFSTSLGTLWILSGYLLHLLEVWTMINHEFRVGAWLLLIRATRRARPISTKRRMDRHVNMSDG